MIILISSLIQIPLNLYINNLFSTIIFIFYFVVLFQKIFNCKRKEAQNYSIIIWLISIILDMLFMIILSILSINPSEKVQTPYYKTIYSSIMALVLIILANSKFIVKELRKIYKKINELKISIYHICIIIVIYAAIAVTSSINIENKEVTVLLVVIGISLLISIIIFITLEYQIFTLKKTNEILEKDNESNLEIIGEYRVLKHNLEHNLMGVKSVSNKKAKELIDDLISEYNSKFYIKHDITSMPAGINGFILEKFNKYATEDLKITVENKIKKKILGLLGPRNYNLFCEALGVTLDNALESSVKSKEKILCLEFKEQKDTLEIEIMNTFKGNIEIDKLGTKEYTSREKGHGLGLYSLLNRKNLFITTSIKNNLFINKIEVKKRKR